MVSQIAYTNGSNFIAAFADDDSFFEFSFFEFRCFGHSLNLAINNGLKLTRFETAVRKCRGIVVEVGKK